MKMLSAIFRKTNTSSRVYALVAMAFPLILIGCDPLPGKPDPTHRPIAPNLVVDFDTLFQANCAGCHGRDGRLGPAPPLNDTNFLAIVPDAELHDLIHNGRAGTLMPGFATLNGGTLTDVQIEVLATGLKSRWPEQKLDSGILPPYLVAAGNLESGKGVFEKACASCHGTEGEGGMVGAINDRAFLSLISDQALRRIVITGRPDLGMPNYADKEGRDDDFLPLTSEEINDVVSLLASWRTPDASPTEQMSGQD